jgi:hypothetical protein
VDAVAPGAAPVAAVAWLHGASCHGGVDVGGSSRDGVTSRDGGGHAMPNRPSSSGCLLESAARGAADASAPAGAGAPHSLCCAAPCWQLGSSAAGDMRADGMGTAAAAAAAAAAATGAAALEAALFRDSGCSTFSFRFAEGPRAGGWCSACGSGHSARPVAASGGCPAEEPCGQR